MDSVTRRNVLKKGCAATAVGLHSSNINSVLKNNTKEYEQNQANMPLYWNILINM